jgi:DDE superfamily endonuclease
LIEQAYQEAPRLGLAVWGMDEAGPYQAIPQPGTHWQALGRPVRYPHEHVRHGTAKLLTLFHPDTGRVRVKGVRSCPNVVLHAWLKQQLLLILDDLPSPPVLSEADNRATWVRWQAGLTVKPTLSDDLPPLRMLLILDNLAGHKTTAFVVWLFAHGVMPVYTPLSGSWLNMTESVQRILVHRALGGQEPASPEDIMTWLEETAHGWNADPTPFIWGGHRRARRERAYRRHHPLGGSGAWTHRPIRRRPVALSKRRLPCQVTH